MDVLLLLLGVVLLIVAVVDALWTTLWVDGGGAPVSSRVASGVWRGLCYVTSRSAPRLLSLSGPLVLLVVLLNWVLMLWAGWTLVFSADPTALTYSDTGERPDWAGRIYFAGYTLFTLGIGNVVPHPGAWEVLTAFASASGMLIVTLGVSYVLSVLGAVVGSRGFASATTGLGTQPAEFVRKGWTGQDFKGLTLPLSTLSSALDVLTQQHLAYPVLHYYHSSDRRAAASYAVAVLDEALTLLRFGVPKEHQPPTAVLEGARSSVASYLDTLEGAYIDTADEAPPPPNLDWLRAEGLPVVSDEAFALALMQLEMRRRKLLGMVQSDGRDWPWEEAPSGRP